MTTDGPPTRTVRPFRFGVVCPVRGTAAQWRDQVRRIAELGYSTLLMPDVQQWQPAPGPALAVAATLAPDLRVGTWVYACPLRPPWQMAWESHSLAVLTDDRFEMGLGTGRPGMAEELRGLGRPVPSPQERLTQLRDTVATLRGLDGPERRTPVVMAVRGPRVRTLAVELADTITFAAVPSDSRADITRMADEVRAARDVELALHVPVVGDTVSPFMAPPDTDPSALHAKDSMQALSSDPTAAAEEILRRREENGFSYVVVGANAVDLLAPVVARLAGQ